MRCDKLYRRLLAIWLIVSVATLAGGSGGKFRVVRVTGERLHLRAHLPVTLNHDGVLRHLHVGEEFTVEKVGYGLRYTGEGMGDVWFFVRSLRDSDEAGWVHSRWLEDIANVRLTEADDGRTTPESTDVRPQAIAVVESAGAATTPSTPLASTSATPTPATEAPHIIVLPPPPPPSFWRDYVPSVMSVLASLITMAALLFPRFFTGGGGSFPPSAPATYANNTRRSNYIYGTYWRIARR
jgi:hypothetical protein